MSGCGCKNKNNGQQQAQPVQTQQQNNESVKNAIYHFFVPFTYTIYHFLPQNPRF